MERRGVGVEGTQPRLIESVEQLKIVDLTEGWMHSS